MKLYIFDSDIDKSIAAHPDQFISPLISHVAAALARVQVTLGDAPICKPSAYDPFIDWVMSSNKAWNLTVKYGIKLCEEFHFRFGKEQAKAGVMQEFLAYKANLPDVGVKYYRQLKAPFMKGTSVEGYRAYAISRAHYPKWTNREKPEWWI